MSAAVAHLAAAQAGDAVSDGLEAQLLQLTRYGLPSLRLFDDGWYCCVAMNTSTPGAEFKVTSEFRHRTASSAVKQAAERVAEALRARGA